MFEIFSDLARQAIMLAQDEAIGRGDDFVGTEHLILGMAGVPGSVAGTLLAERGLTVELARSRLSEIRAAAAHAARGPPMTTPRRPPSNCRSRMPGNSATTMSVPGTC